MSSSVCRGGIDTRLRRSIVMAAALAMDRAFQSDSIRCEIAPRCFLHWYDAAIAEKGDDGEGANEEGEVEECAAGHVCRVI